MTTRNKHAAMEVWLKCLHARNTAVNVAWDTAAYIAWNTLQVMLHGTLCR